MGRILKSRRSLSINCPELSWVYFDASSDRTRKMEMNRFDWELPFRLRMSIVW